MAFCTVECPPGGASAFTAPAGAEDTSCSVVYGVRRVDLFRDLGLNRQDFGEGGSTAHAAQLTARLASVLNEMYACAAFRQLRRRGGDPVASELCLAALSWRMKVLEDDVLEVLLTGQVLAAPARRTPPTLRELGPSLRFLVPQGTAALHRAAPPPEEDRAWRHDADAAGVPPAAAGPRLLRRAQWLQQELMSPVLVSALSSVPHRQVRDYCGLVTVHMIKETANVVRQFESLQVFYRGFVAEALLTARAHVLARGGDALLSFRINTLKLSEDRRRAYAVISISGDAAKLCAGEKPNAAAPPPLIF
ncbi:unnamed protein product [Prorocentrum cordatum]|uniref:C2CD5 C-terminal domain-containing protein n=1 Tax=Prorocentrum cordatum TaxID=2364126 RepID=A0ABN9TA50_9DINO|nr:unnamed protein product [Polarella glacialis]